MFVGEKERMLKRLELGLFLFLCCFFLTFFLRRFLPVLFFFAFFPFFFLFFFVIGVALHVLVLRISLKALWRVYMRFVSRKRGWAGFLGGKVAVLWFFFAL